MLLGAKFLEGGLWVIITQALRGHELAFPKCRGKFMKQRGGSR